MCRAITHVFFVLLLGLFASYDAYACSCVDSPTARKLGKSEAVFIGQIPVDDSKIPDDDSQIQGDGTEILEVIKSWKGVRKKYVSVNFDFSTMNVTCGFFYRFEENKKYIVFAYGKELKIKTYCSDTKEIFDKTDGRYEYQQKEINKLDNFWFRFWVRANPF